MAVSKNQLDKLINRAKELNKFTPDPAFDEECYEDHFIQSLFGEDIEGCMAICKAHNLHTDTKILSYIASRIFNE